jgi:serine/threonine-protein kinase PpkA
MDIRGYELKAKIGEGGMASVYRAHQQRLDRDIALKVLLPRFSQDADFAERFLREARIAAQLNHPNIVQIYDVDSADGQLFLSMELVSGGDLSRKLRSGENSQQALTAFQELCKALDYAHQKGYVHRDIKPANILFREDGSLALSDFGIARAMHSDTNITRTGIVVGTPSYMSPEQAQGFELDGRSDFYSVAVIAYQYVTGQLPYTADSSISVAIKHISEPVPRLPIALSALQDFFDRALAKNPEQRFENGERFFEAFQQGLENISDFEQYHQTTEIARQPLKTQTMHRAAPTEDFVKPPALRGNEGWMALTQATMQIFIVQINRIKVFFQSPFDAKKLLGLVFAGGLVALLTYFLAQSDLLKQEQISPGEQIRLAQWLSAADEAIANKHYLEPVGESAVDYLRKIETLTPDDPVVKNAYQHILSSLQADALGAISGKDIVLTQNLLDKLEAIDERSPEAKNISTQLSNLIDDQNSHRHAQIEIAENYIDQEQYTEAIQVLDQLVEDQGLHETSKELLIKIINQTQSVASTLANQENYKAATVLIEHGISAANLLGDSVQVRKLRQLSDNYQQQDIKKRQEQFSRDLLNKAELALNNNQLVTPLSANAWYYYNEVLKRSPNNAQAQQGKAKVIDALVEKSHEQIAEDALAEAKVSIKSLERIAPGHSELSSLRRELQLAEREQQRDRQLSLRIETLYSRADRYLEAKRPASADKIWLQIQRLDSGHSGLDELGQKIAGGYVFLAQREIDAQDWKDVNVWVERGLKHEPKHKKLLEMRAFAEEKMRAR